MTYYAEEKGKSRFLKSFGIPPSSSSFVRKAKNDTLPKFLHRFWANWGQFFIKTAKIKHTSSSSNSMSVRLSWSDKSILFNLGRFKNWIYLKVRYDIEAVKIPPVGLILPTARLFLIFRAKLWGCCSSPPRTLSFFFRRGLSLACCMHFSLTNPGVEFFLAGVSVCFYLCAVCSSRLSSSGKDV